MGTLGCINDMLRRDRENRELRRRSREHLADARRKLLDMSRKQDHVGISPEKLECIARKSREREEVESKRFFRSALLFLTVALGVSLLFLIFILI